MSKIAVIGSNMVDLITYIDRMPAQGETLEAPGFALGCGGKGANQAVAAAKLGAEVVMLSKVGDDMFADNTLANFQRFGIDTRYVQRVPGVSSGVAPIFVQADSHNSILIVKGANAHLLPADIDAAAADLRECTLIVLQLEINLETVYYAIEFAHRHGIAVLLNPAPALAGLSAEHLSQLDFLIPNESELALITGLVVDSPDSARNAARTLVASGIRHVIVTLGELSSMAWAQMLRATRTFCSITLMVRRSTRVISPSSSSTLRAGSCTRRTSKWRRSCCRQPVSPKAITPKRPKARCARWRQGPVLRSV
ncbi:ribokinase [Pseudomonas sp. D2002]|uniref:ribokinase n=1 Tax=Pseudomonas sp. D2002 TaxID=2726980 RepID=UPI00210D4FAE|nr:ribokinase [Pseudomonas sp. D2002]